MFKSLRTFFLAGLLSCILLVPQVTRATTTTTDDAYRAYLLQVIMLLQEQIRILQLELAERQINESAAVDSLSSQVTMLSRYAVGSLDDAVHIPEEAERAYFMRVAELVPDTYHNRFVGLGVYGGQADFDAFVETLPPQHETWLYAAHEDLLIDPTASWNTELIVHELAHVVSLDSVEDLARDELYRCEREMAVPNCPPTDSYVGQFIKQFWGDGKIGAVEHAVANDRLSSYYKVHDDEFVSEYAASAPEEDFADSFMFYMLGKRSEGRVAKEKTAFFSGYEMFADIKIHVQAAK